MTTLAAPQPALTVLDAVGLIVGGVIGVGIFKTPAIVAAQTGDAGVVMLVWLLGGAISLVGALCYAELASAYPHAGGDYHYLCRAFGRGLAFLFAWARMTVIQTGSIALQAFLIGDYASELLPLGVHSASVYAGLVIITVTGVNVAGLRMGRWTQQALTGATVLGLMFIAVAGLWLASSPTDPGTPAPSAPASPAAALSLAMVFVRTSYALGLDLPLLRSLGRWHDRTGTPANALLAQGGIALALVLLGTVTRSGFSTMVEYTAPVFWFFFLQVGVSLLVLRRKEAHAVRPFLVPLYPLTPLLFCAICVYMLQSSLAYAGTGAWVRVAVLLAGLPLTRAACFRAPRWQGK